ncbi:hypothetical protein AAFC00_000717 [Neodothiora populina]|uniref:Glutamyl-tRNA synthetase n=1 Tax=Neodothiora populina TaxID=2781224 RepID=A0ABR3PDV8_9PEZI
MAPNYKAALKAIDEAHAQDPKKVTIDGTETPYELHYANKMTAYLDKRSPDASDVVKLAIRAQHFRRWEVPRDSYPMTRIGYHSWRTYLKKRQAQLVAPILQENGYSDEDIIKCRGMIEKQGLAQGNADTQVLEDVACLVFLDDQFEAFEKEHDEDKIIKILQKTWGKMSPEGHKLALEMHMAQRSQELVEKALAG